MKSNVTVPVEREVRVDDGRWLMVKTTERFAPFAGHSGDAKYRIYFLSNNVWHLRYENLHRDEAGEFLDWKSGIADQPEWVERYTA